MKKTTIFLALILLVGCDNNQEPSTLSIKSYQFEGADEKKYIIKEQCLLQNAQKCETEHCNEFVPGLCENEGEAYTFNAFFKNEFMCDTIRVENILRDNNLDPYNPAENNCDRAERIIDQSESNERYRNVSECKFEESRKCLTDGCSEFVSGYCESFKYFKGEKLAAENDRKALIQEERKKEIDRYNLVVSSPNSTDEEKAEVFCLAKGGFISYGFSVNLDAVLATERYFEDKYTCEQWYLMTDQERLELDLPKKEEYYWQNNPDNPNWEPKTNP